MQRDSTGHRGQRRGRWDSETLTPGCTYILTASHGDDAFRIAQVNSTGGLTLKAVTLSGGRATTTGQNNGGGILNYGAVTLTGSHLAGNTAGGLGGAIHSAGIPASATFTSSTVTANTATNCTGSLSPVPGCIG